MRIPSASPSARRPTAAAVGSADGVARLCRELAALLPDAESFRDLLGHDLVRVFRRLQACAADPRALGSFLSRLLGVRVCTRSGRLRCVRPTADQPVGVVGSPLDGAMRLGGVLLDGSRELVVHLRCDGPDLHRLCEARWVVAGHPGVRAARLAPGDRLRAVVAWLLPVGTPIRWALTGSPRRRRLHRLGVSRVGELQLAAGTS